MIYNSLIYFIYTLPGAVEKDEEINSSNKILRNVFWTETNEIFTYEISHELNKIVNLSVPIH